MFTVKAEAVQFFDGIVYSVITNMLAGKSFTLNASETEGMYIEIEGQRAYVGDYIVKVCNCVFVCTQKEFNDNFVKEHYNKVEGKVDNKKLLLFMYLLLKDMLPTGDVNKLVNDSYAYGKAPIFTDKFLEAKAKDIIRKLEE